MIETEVQFKSGNFNLSGTLTVPDAVGPFPGVLLIPGSGEIDRNENHKKEALNVFRDIASYLSKNGIATLRYDKRGVGKSNGDFLETGLFDNASDTLAALSFLKKQEQIRSNQTYLLGHSEGALLSTIIVADGAEVAGLILLAGTAQPGEQVLLWQTEKVAEGLGGIRKWIIKLFRIDVMRAQQKQIDKVKRSKKKWYRVQIFIKLNAKWMREFLAYNPADDLAKIQVPALAITGSKDIQVNPDDLKVMAKLIQTDFEYHEIPDLTHILRVDKGEPSISTYKKQLQQPTDPRVLKMIVQWLKNKTL